MRVEGRRGRECGVWRVQVKPLDCGKGEEKLVKGRAAWHRSRLDSG